MGLRNTVDMRDEVDKKLRHYIDGVKTRTKQNLNDGAVDSEGFFRNLLNLLYGFNLSKENIESANNDTIDLHCIEQSLCLQVTAQNTKQKVDKTIVHFIKKERYKIYKKLYFLILDHDKKFRYNTEKLSEYNVEIKFIDYSTIFQKLIVDFDSFDKMFEVYDFVMKDLDEDYSNKIKAEKRVNHNNTNNFEELKGLHIVDQIYTVLKMFDGFKCIYPRTLSKLYPFSTEKRTYDAYSNYCLKTNNKEIHQLLQKVKIDVNKDIEIKDEELQPYSDKLKEIFTILNSSLIYCICYREKYTEIEHHKIQVNKYIANCNCHQCQYHNFNTQNLFELLKSKTIKHSDEFSEALSEGYYLCKLGEHVKGWQIFNSIAEKSKVQNKSISNFIAQHNILAIYNFIDLPWFENEAKEILPKIEIIDLHNTLCGLEVPLPVRDELIKVKEDYHLNYSREKIEEYSESIRSIKVLYEGKGSSSGTPATELLMQEIRLLFSFYSMNNIITDDFNYFKATITKGIDALFNSYTTDKRYNYKYKEFDNFILTMTLFYVEEDSIKRIFYKYDIKKIEISEIDKKEFVKVVAKFFTSQVTTNKWSGAEFYEGFNKQDYFSHYRQFLRHLFNRAMLILSKVNLSKEDLKPIAQPFIDFLSASEDFSHSSWEYVSKFLSEHVQVFDDKQIISIIESTLSEKNHRNGENSLRGICDIAAEKANFIIHDKNIFVKVLNKISNPCPTCNRIHNIKLILAIWSVADEQGKLIIKQKAVECLEKNFEADFYQRAVFYDILDKDQYPEFLESYITYAQNHSHLFDIKEENGHWIFQSFTGYNCLNCLAYMKVDFSLSSIQQIAQKSDYYNWIINFENFDYSNFNFKWLIDACPYYLQLQLYKVEALKQKVEYELCINYSPELASFYFKHLVRCKE